MGCNRPTTYQLPATIFPTSSDAALTQLKQAFPALSGYKFIAVPSTHDNQNGYGFYATRAGSADGQSAATAVATGVVKLGDNIWVFAMIGTGVYSTSVPA